MLPRNGLGSIHSFWTNFFKNLKTINLESLLQFAQLRPYFNQIFNMNPKKRSGLKISCHIGIWAAKARLLSIGIKPFGKRLYKL